MPEPHPIRITRGRMDRHAIAFYDGDRFSLLLAVASGYISVHRYCSTDAKPRLEAAGFCIPQGLTTSYVITALTTYDDVLFVLVHIPDVSKNHLLSCSLHPFITPSDDETSGLCLMTPVDVCEREFPRALISTIRVLKYETTSILVLITKEGGLYYCSGTPLITRKIPLKGVCHSVLESNERSTLFYFCGENMVGRVDSDEVVKYADPKQLQEKCAGTPLRYVDVLHHGRFVLAITDEGNIVQLYRQDLKLTKYVLRKTPLVINGAIFSRQHIFMFGAQGAIRVFDSNTLDSRGRLLIGGFKHLERFGSLDVICFHAHREHSCVVLEDGTMCLFSTSQTQVRGTQQFYSLRSIFYGTTPLMARQNISALMAEKYLISYSYALGPGSELIASFRDIENNTISFAEKVPYLRHLCVAGHVLVGMALKEDVRAVCQNSPPPRDVASYICFYHIPTKVVHFLYPLTCSAGVSHIHASLLDEQVHVYFTTGEKLYYLRKVPVPPQPISSASIQISSVSLPSVPRQILISDVPSVCYIIENGGHLHQIVFTARSAFCKPIFRAPSTFMDMFGAQLARNGSAITLGMTYQVSPITQLLRSEVIVVLIDNINTRVFLRQVLAESTSLADLPEGPHALTTGYLYQEDDSPVKGEALSDLIYAVLFKHKQRLAIYSAFLNCSLANIDTLRFDQLSSGYSLRFDATGSLNVLLEEERTCLTFTPIIAADVYQRLGAEPMHTSDPLLELGEGTFFDGGHWSQSTNTLLSATRLCATIKDTGIILDPQANEVSVPIDDAPGHNSLLSRNATMRSQLLDEISDVSDSDLLKAVSGEARPIQQESNRPEKTSNSVVPDVFAESIARLPTPAAILTTPMFQSPPAASTPSPRITSTTGSPKIPPLPSFHSEGNGGSKSPMKKAATPIIPKSSSFPTRSPGSQGNSQRLPPSQSLNSTISDVIDRLSTAKDILISVADDLQRLREDSDRNEFTSTMVHAGPRVREELELFDGAYSRVVAAFVEKDARPVTTAEGRRERDLLLSPRSSILSQGPADDSISITHLESMFHHLEDRLIQSVTRCIATKGGPDEPGPLSSPARMTAELIKAINVPENEGNRLVPKK
ncbi:hypothetical protein GMRT_10232 [Giardia muris]|uniref:Uncharacterized protein n=1 Tax=Giardia muris TaxID=5742 RepID=A0A4Z1SXC4_GIAMU|nr:hypothetical protein GMRT_10232 [Giardia muris]|eukprot:TNJ29475.1 hypothetical protein GMRT_10232 [Giardia muris]